MQKKSGRNDPCSCGSGKKFKHCCENKKVTSSAQGHTPGPTQAELQQLVILHNGKRYAEVEGPARALVAKYPNAGLVWKILAYALQFQGKDAMHAFQKAAQLLPGEASLPFNLAAFQKHAGMLTAAVASYRCALKINPKFAEAYNNLGTLLHETGQVGEAVSCFRKVVQLLPDTAQAHNNLGAALFEFGHAKEGADACRRSVALNPNFSEAHNNLGRCLQELSQYDEAESHYRQALKLIPENFKALGNLGNLLKDTGLLDEAMTSYQTALDIKPDLSEAHSNLLLLQSYSAKYSPEYCLEHARNFGDIVTTKAASRFTTWQCAKQPERLRVGMVSGDFRNHSVGHFLVGLLPHIDPDRIELIAYPTHSQEDSVTARIRPSFSQWHPLYGKNDEDAARLIHDDGIHVLMDISGHTAFNRLPVFAWKPAPVQVAWLGLPNTTGVSEIDYLLGDALATPVEIASHFSETLWRMPESYLCFSPPVQAVNVSPLPAQSAGHVTFGSFNNLTKMNDEVVELWSRILLSVPDSRLYLKTGQLDSEDICETTRTRFLKHGITPERLLLKGKTSSAAEHLAEYNKVDIALDPFPYPGATTSIEAMWMGVPVLTLHGNRFVSLIAKSVAHYSGLPDWVATDKDDCVTKAVSFTSDLDRLSSLRAGLREQVLASSIFDAPRFAKNIEQALLGMWQAGGCDSHAN
ncbi:MAG: tetratricopeptide repeat protein [Gallionella sp.]